jgi:hypothetical protein
MLLYKRHIQRIRGLTAETIGDWEHAQRPPIARTGYGEQPQNHIQGIRMKGSNPETDIAISVPTSHAMNG